MGLCQNVGTPKEVRISREMMDAYDEIERLVWLIERQDIMISGSHREGFRLETSDFDQMTWLSDHKVICDLSQISLYRMPQHTVILMECEGLPPGFTRLKLMTLSWHTDVTSSSVIINGESYVSSSLFKSRFLQSMQSQGVLAGGPYHTDHLPLTMFMDRTLTVYIVSGLTIGPMTHFNGFKDVSSSTGRKKMCYPPS